MTTHSIHDDPNCRAEPQLTWQAHPARQRPRHTMLAVALIVGLAIGVWVLTQSPWWTVGAAALLVLSLNRFFFPSTFSIDDIGITARYPLRTLRFSWNRLRRFVHDSYGGYLSTRTRRSRLDAWTGMHIIFGSDETVGKGGAMNRQHIIEAIRARVRKETTT